LNQLEDVHEIKQGDHVTVGDLNTTFNPIPSIIQNMGGIQTSEVDAKHKTVTEGPYNSVC
jgi:hypothetical protein